MATDKTIQCLGASDELLAKYTFARSERLVANKHFARSGDRARSDGEADKRGSLGHCLNGFRKRSQRKVSYHDEEFPVPTNFVAGLVPLVNQDAQLLATLRGLAEEFLQLTAAPVAAPTALNIAAAPPVPDPAALRTDSLQHTCLSPSIEAPTARVQRLVSAESDLQLVESRCRLKAEGARWTANRQRKILEGASFCTEIDPMDREIIDKAKTLAGCFMWMNHPSAPVPTDLGLWDDVADCFESAAMAVALLRRVIEKADESRRFLEQVLDLTAEAQSALRMAVQLVDGKPDNDQLSLFNWLRRTAEEQQIFITRFMRVDHPADPTRWKDLQERIGQLDSEIDEFCQRERRRVALLRKGQYHAQAIGNGKGTENDWTEGHRSHGKPGRRGHAPQQYRLAGHAAPHYR